MSGKGKDCYQIKTLMYLICLGIDWLERQEQKTLSDGTLTKRQKNNAISNYFGHQSSN